MPDVLADAARAAPLQELEPPLRVLGPPALLRARVHHRVPVVVLRARRDVRERAAREPVRDQDLPEALRHVQRCARGERGELDGKQVGSR